MSNTKGVNKMKVLKGLEELKHMYDQIRNEIYRFLLQHIIDEAWRHYGLKGVCEVIDFIQSETE